MQLWHLFLRFWHLVFLIFAGIWEFANGILDILNFLFHKGEHRIELSVHFISAIDMFMVAGVMFIMGIGLFELFVDRDRQDNKLPALAEDT